MILDGNFVLFLSGFRFFNVFLTFLECEVAFYGVFLIILEIEAVFYGVFFTFLAGKFQFYTVFYIVFCMTWLRGDF